MEYTVKIFPDPEFRKTNSCHFGGGHWSDKDSQESAYWINACLGFLGVLCDSDREH